MSDVVDLLNLGTAAAWSAFGFLAGWAVGRDARLHDQAAATPRSGYRQGRGARHRRARTRGQEGR